MPRTFVSYLLSALFLVTASSPATSQPSGAIVGWGEQCIIEPALYHFTKISAGVVHTLGLTSDGAIVTWGRNSFAQCDVPAPNANFIAIALNGHALGLRSNGTIAAWGGGGGATPPVPNADFVAIDAGSFFSVALKSNGSVVIWGNCYQGAANSCDF